MSIHRKRMPIPLYLFSMAVLSMWSAETLTAGPAPGNAALIYYQAFLVRPEPDERAEINQVLNGAPPGEELNSYLARSSCRDAISLTKLATQITACDWGLVPLHPRGFASEMLQELRQLGILIEVDARALASQQSWQPALEMCLVLRRFAAHIGDDSYLMYSIADALDRRALACIRDILEAVPRNTQTFTWLQEALHATEGARWHPQEAFRSWRDMEYHLWRMWPGEDTFSRSDFLKRRDIEKVNDEDIKRKIMDMTDEQLAVLLLLDARMSRGVGAISVPPSLLLKAREACDIFLKLSLEAIASNAPYEETHSRLEQMVVSLEDRVREGEPIALLSEPLRSVPAYYRLRVGNLASLNLTLAAIELYLFSAKTGCPPNTLPEGLPQDPYSGRDLQYRRTESGFTLGLDPDNVAGLRQREFVFKVQ